GRFEQFIPYLLGYDRELQATLAMASEELHPSSVLRDSAITSKLGETWNGLHFNLGATMAAEELRNYLEHDSIPRISLSVDSLGVRLPVYAEIADLSLNATLGRDTLAINDVKGTIGNSQLEFSGRVINFGPVINQDTGITIQVDYQISSDLLYVSDLFTFHQRFLLPDSLRKEHLENLMLAGSVEVPSSSLNKEGIPEEISLKIQGLEAKYSGYPLPVSQFHADLRRDHTTLYVDQLRGKVGVSNLSLNAMVDNFTDTVLSGISGYVTLQSDLLDLNELLKFSSPVATVDSVPVDSSGSGAPPLFFQFDYPDFELTLDIGTLNYSDYTLVGLGGKLRTSKEKIFYFDRLTASLDRGGNAEFSGQLNVSDPFEYALSTNFDVKDIDVNTLDLKMEAGEETYSLKENFRGLVSADGLAEVFLTPELSLDLPTTTAVFNVKVVDGELINFTPLQAAAKYLDNKDLNHVRFATLENSFPMTVANSRIIVPLTIIESTIGQMLIEGEQGLDGSYLYLMRLPAWLVRGAARSRLSSAGDDQKEDEIQEYRSGTFMNVTAWGEGEESEVKLGDRRDRYR
ncbi:MAG: hypothetical protein P8100_12145, partial [bacterium]